MKQHVFFCICVMCVLSLAGGLPAAAQEDVKFQESRAEIRAALRFDDLEAKGWTDGEAKGPLTIAPDSYGEELQDKPIARARILFDIDSAAIRTTDDSLTILRNYADVLRDDYPDAIFVIVGHTDSSGTDAHNWGLSQRRAESVRSFLVKTYDIAPDRLVTKWFGETQPIASNAAETGRAQNRRVEFIRVR
jgi:outer membrane protein OmpA-like peptidoglycan-associated protein